MKKKQKKKTKKTPYKKAKEKAWNTFSEFIRKRDCRKTTGSLDRGICCTCEALIAYKGSQPGHFIDGKWVAAQHSNKVDIVNPSTEQVIAQISFASQQDVVDAVSSADHAFQNAWAETTPYQRGVKLNKLADLIEQYAEELAQLESLSTGKLIHISRHLEVAQSIIFLRYFAGWATKIHGQTMQPSIPSTQGEKYTAFTLRQPVGVVAGIVPWNFSLMIGIWKIGSALTTGCSIVLKPSEFASLSLLRLAELAIEAGIPAGVINVVTGKGETGQYHPYSAVPAQRDGRI